MIIAIVTAATEASTRRTAFSDRLDEEAPTLDDAEQTLTITGEQYEQVTEHSRQQQSVEDLRETRTYPVLVDTTTVLEQCTTARRRIEDELVLYL